MRLFTIFLCIAAFASIGCERIPTIEITSTPSGATVFIDGMEVGTTPYKSHVSSEATHRVLVSKLGYHAATAEQTQKGETFTRGFQLKKISLSDMILIPAGNFIMGTSDEEEQLLSGNWAAARWWNTPGGSCPKNRSGRFM